MIGAGVLVASRLANPGRASTAAMAKMRSVPMRCAVKPFGKSGLKAASQAFSPPA